MMLNIQFFTLFAQFLLYIFSFLGALYLIDAMLNFVLKKSKCCRRCTVVIIDDGVDEVEFALTDCFEKSRKCVGGSMAILCRASDEKTKKIVQLFSQAREIPSFYTAEDLTAFISCNSTPCKNELDNCQKPQNILY